MLRQEPQQSFPHIGKAGVSIERDQGSLKGTRKNGHVSYIYIYIYLFIYTTGPAVLQGFF